MTETQPATVSESIKLGILCESCGESIDGISVGHLRSCSECADDIERLQAAAYETANAAETLRRLRSVNFRLKRDLEAAKREVVELVAELERFKAAVSKVQP